MRTMSTSKNKTSDSLRIRNGINESIKKLLMHQETSGSVNMNDGTECT